MSYAISLGKKARKFLGNLTDVKLRSRLVEAIDGLAENPRPTGCEILKASEGIHRIRVGDYRILYVIQQERLLVLVVSIGDRKDIHR